MLTLTPRTDDLVSRVANRMHAASRAARRQRRGALIVPGPLVSVIRGKVGGVVFSHNRGGDYARVFQVPTNPSSPEQDAVRNALAQLVNFWTEDLTEVQRDGWQAYADAVPVTNNLGASRTLTGQNWYVGANVGRLQAGLAVVDDAPTLYDRGANDATMTFLPSAGSQNAAVTFDDTLDWTSEDGAGMLIYCSRPQNASVNFLSSGYQFAGVLLGDSGTPLTSPQLVGLPFPFAEGQKLFFRVTISRADGRYTSDAEFQGVAVA